ncbi:AraC family transcriptional regulator [Clostridium saccharoperbutylacetonicum]
MVLEELDSWLHEYTKEELFYKEYYDAKNNKNTLKKFIETIDLDFINEKHILIPELSEMPSFMGEDPIAAAGIDIEIVKHPRYTPTFTHSHTFFEMFYVYSGSCTQEISGTSINFKEGDICIISPGTKHSMSIFNDNIVINILIRKTTFNETFFELLKGNNILSMFFKEILYGRTHKNYLIFHTGHDSKLNTVLLDMFNEFISNNKYSRNIINNLLVIFFAYLLQNHEKDVEVPLQTFDESSLLPQILFYIEENYLDITLEKLCEKFHFSNAYLSRMIKNSTGLNFTAIIKNIRLKKACIMLEATNISIRDISENVGYSSQEHFIRTFKKAFSMSPTEYRKHNTIKLDIR